MRRIVIRYRTPLGGFVLRMGGVHSFARAVDVAPTTVYNWLAGTRSPTPSRAMTIVQLSGGALRLEDVFAQRAVTKEP